MVAAECPGDLAMRERDRERSEGLPLNLSREVEREWPSAGQLPEAMLRRDLPRGGRADEDLTGSTSDSEPAKSLS
jgi:hypothetical protein